MCVEIIFMHVDCHCIARIGTYTCASQSYRKVGFTNQCPNFKSTQQWLRVGARTCRDHVGMVVEDVVVDVDSSGDELVVNQRKLKGKGEGKQRIVDCENGGNKKMGDGGSKGVEGIEAESEGDAEAVGVDMEGDTDYYSESSSSSSSGEEITEREDPVVVIDRKEGKMDHDAFKSDGEEDGYKGDNETSSPFSHETPAGFEPQINRVTTPVFNKSTNNEATVIPPSSGSSISDHDHDTDDEGWVNTSSPIEPSPLSSKPTTYTPTFTDSPTKRPLSGELTAAMASLSLTRTTPNTRIPSSTRPTSVPRPATARSVARYSKSTSESPNAKTKTTESKGGGLPYLRRTLGSGILNTKAVSGVPGNGSGSGSGSQIPRRTSSTRSLPVESASGEGSSVRDEEVARRRLLAGKSLRDLIMGVGDGSLSSGNGNGDPAASSNVGATAQFSTIENPSVSRRSMAHAAAIAAVANEENKALGNGRELRHVGTLNRSEKELPTLPKGDLGVGNGGGGGVERALPELPRSLGGGFDGGERERARRE